MSQRIFVVWFGLRKCLAISRFLSMITLLMVICSSNLAFAAVGAPQLEQMRLQPLAFTENHGQWPDNVLFRANGGGATLWFTKEGITYQFTRKKDRAGAIADHPQLPTEIPEIEQLLVNSTFVGANPNPVARGESMMEYKCNFFLGNDSTSWRTEVPNYESIVLENVYDGIDLRFYGTGEKLEYDFIVAPGADYSQIQIQYDGAKSLTVDDHGNLVVETGWGCLTQQTPLVYQLKGGERQTVAGEFMILSPSSIGFRLSTEYDPAFAVFIDPVLTFSTYLGGTASDYANDIAVNASGEAFLCGYTTSSDFPRVNPYDNTLGLTDAFVTKFNASGTGLVYSTYFGGAFGTDMGIALALYGDEAYLLGQTTSDFDFPTPSGIDQTFNGGQDCFLAVLSAAGNTLRFCTYLGGSGNDYAYDIALRCPSPCLTTIVKVYVVGSTGSLDFPTPNAYDATQNGNLDAFMAVYTISPLVKSLDFGTYLGGSASDWALAVAISGSSTLIPHIAGETNSSDFPTANAYDNSFTGTVDAFVASFGVAGNGSLFLLNSTFFGGSELADPSQVEVASAMLIRSSGNICIAGHTSAPGLGTAGSYDPTYNGGTDVYIAEFNSSVTSLVYCTYLGDTEVEAPGYGCLSADVFDNLYLGGATQSTNFPLADAYDASLGGSRDAFIAKLSGDGSTLFFGTYLGGTSDDYGNGLAVDASGCIYSCGFTNSSDFPIVNPYDGSLGGTGDAYLTKICLPICGDADGSQSVDVSDVVYLIAYIFGGGPAPSPLLAGDADCSSNIDISDAVYLVAYIFGGGPAPCAGC